MYDEKMQAAFVQHIVHAVRDEIIRATDRAINGERRDIYGRYIHGLAAQLTDESKEFAQALIPYIVDGTISVFLQQFDIHRDTLQIHVQKDDGTLTNILEWTDGLEGEYTGSGWVQEFSQERQDTIRREAERLAEEQRSKSK